MSARTVITLVSAETVPEKETVELVSADPEGSTSAGAMVTGDAMPELKQKGSPAEIGMKLSPTVACSEADGLVRSPRETELAGDEACSREAAQGDEGWSGEAEQMVTEEENETCRTQSEVNLDFQKSQKPVNSEAVVNVEGRDTTDRDGEPRDERSQAHQTMLSSGGGEQASLSMEEEIVGGETNSGGEEKPAKAVSMKEEE